MSRKAFAIANWIGKCRRILQKSGQPLFLGGSGFILFCLLPLLPDTYQSGLAPRIPELPVRLLFSFRHITLLDLADSVRLGLVQDGQDMVCLVCHAFTFRGSFHIFFGGVRFLELARFAREQDETGAVRLETVHVGIKGVDAEVGAAMVDRDADGGGEFAGDSCLL